MTQPFVFIFMMVVIVLIVIVGFRMLNNVKNVGEDVEYETFFINLQKEVDMLKNLDKGSSVSLRKLSVPETILEVCFIGEGSFIASNVENQDQLFLTALQVPEGKSVFVYVDMPTKTYDFLFIEDIKGDFNPTCSSTIDGVIDLRMTNQGSHILVEELL